MALTKTDLAKCLQDEIGMSKAECMEFVGQFFSVIIDSLARGEEVELRSFGRFTLHDKRERPGRNPRTGEVVPITARTVVTFRAGETLKSKVEARLQGKLMGEHR